MRQHGIPVFGHNTTMVIALRHYTGNMSAHVHSKRSRVAATNLSCGSSFGYPPRPLSFPTPGKTVPHHPLGDGHQVTVHSVTCILIVRH